MKNPFKAAARLLSVPKRFKPAKGATETGKAPSQRPQTVRFRIRCNLCGRAFRANLRHLRFCNPCRAHDETYRFADWV